MSEAGRRIQVESPLKQRPCKSVKHMETMRDIEEHSYIGCSVIFYGSGQRQRKFINEEAAYLAILEQSRCC